MFEDETDLLLFPPLRAAWAPRGQPLEVRLSGFNARRVVFGAIDVTTGHRLFLGRHRQRGEDFRDYLAVVHRQDRGWQGVMILDEDPSPPAQDSQRLAERLRIERLGLPKRCPELNGMDHLWGHGKDHRSANKQYGDIEAQAEDFVTDLRGLSNRDALRQAGLLSEDFWLRGAV